MYASMLNLELIKSQTQNSQDEDEQCFFLHCLYIPYVYAILLEIQPEMLT